MKFFNNKKSFTLLTVLFCILVALLAACDDTATQSTPANGAVTTVSGTAATSQNKDQNNSQTVAAASTAPVNDGRIVLKIWTAGWKGNAQVEEFFNKNIDNYRTLHPNFTVDWQDYGGDTATKLAEVLPGQDTPDLILVNPADLYNFAARNQLADLDKLGGTDLQTKYVSAAWNALSWDTHSYGIPWLASTRLTLINKNLWQQAGLTSNDLPKSFDDLNKNLATLRDKTAKDVTVAWLHPDPLPDLMMEGVSLYETGGDGVSKVAAFNNTSAEGRWEYYNQLRKSLYLAEAGLNGSEADALKLYSQNKLIMVLDGTNILTTLKSQFPDLYKNSTVITYPTSRGQTLPMSLQGWAIPQNSAQKTLALDFVQYLTTNDNELNFAKFFSTYVPTLKTALTDPYVTSQDEPLAQARAAFVQNFDKMRVPEQLLPQPSLPVQRQKLIAALDAAQKAVWTKQMSAKDALAQAAKTWNELLK